MIRFKEPKRFQFYPHLKNMDAVDLFIENTRTKDFFKQSQPVSFKFDEDNNWDDDSLIGVGILYWDKSEENWYLLNEFKGDYLRKKSWAWKKHGLMYRLHLDRYDLRDIITDGQVYEFAEILPVTEKAFQTAKKMIRTLTWLGYDVTTDGKMYRFGCGKVKLPASTIELVYNTIKAMPSRDLSKLSEANQALIDNPTYSPSNTNNIFEITDRQFRHLLGKKPKK